MEINCVGAGRGAGWYADGWAIVKGQIGMWLLLVIIYLGLAVALSIIPMIGQLAFTLISPALTGGIFLAAHEAGAGRTINVRLMFQPLMDERTRGPMLTLGAISIAFSLLLIISIMAMLGGAAGTHEMLADDPAALEAAMMNAGMAGLLALLLLSLLFTLAMLYAAPLVLFGRQSPIDALKLSLQAGLRNWLPLTLFGLIFIPVALLATLPMMLGWLFLLPVIFAALYSSYRDMFGIDDDAQIPAPPSGQLQL